MTPGENAILYCEGAFTTTNGKTAHGLVRRSERYRILSVVDSRCAGQDAGQVLDRRDRGIPIQVSLTEALNAAEAAGSRVSYLIVGLAPDGGRLGDEARADVRAAIDAGLHVVSGLHDFLADDPELARLALERGVTLHDVRRPPPTESLHFFCGKIEEVTCLRIAVLGTDSAVGKRTTAWRLVDGLRAAGFNAELIGTGQTAWMQGASYGVVMDALVNDFVTGEIEHAVHRAWREKKPDVLVIEGQGSLLNPAYPGGFEVLAAARPDLIVMQHVPTRTAYDGFERYPLHPLPLQIQVAELISGKPVVAVTINHSGLEPEQVSEACAKIEAGTGRPALDVLLHGQAPLVRVLAPHLPPSPAR